jgi:tRNA(Ile)-lysidine synthase
MDLLNQVRQFIERHQLLTRGRPVVVGVSGGPDSLCLLHLLMRLQEECRVTVHAAHLNHQIRGAEADADAEFVRQIALSWRLPITLEQRDVPALAEQQKLAIEEAARVARYSFLVRVARAVGATEIAVAHHADDQVETVLMHWLRGSGLAGLKGMSPATRLSDLRLDPESAPLLGAGEPLRLIRPLLDTPKPEIERYCQEQGLQPRFDRSNLDTTFFRNRLRHELIPILEGYNPNIRQVILRSARVLADEHTFLHREMQKAWAAVVKAEAARLITFDLEAWRALPVNLQRSTLREAIHRLRPPLRDINWVHVENALRVLNEKSTGAAATLAQGLIVRIGYQQFVIEDEEPQTTPTDVSWPDQPVLLVEKLDLQAPGVTTLPGTNWRARVEVIPRAALSPEALHAPQRWEAFLDYEIAVPPLALRRRASGDRFQPMGMAGHEKSLREIMINDKIPSQLRDLVPLLASDRHLLWIVGGRVDERARIRPQTERVLHITLFREDAS